MNRMKQTIATLAIMIMVCSVATAKTFVVSVGVKTYKNPKLNTLHLPVNDAQTVKYIYDKNGNSEVIFLADAYATKQNILAQMKRLYALASENDIILLFFSGHGYQGGFSVYDGNLSYSSIRNVMASSRSKNKMIFADACYSGQMRGQTSKSQSNSNELKNLNVMLFLSSRSSETSIERRGDSNGIFTTALQAALRGNADKNRDRVITAKELFDYVSSRVSTETRGKQHPVMWGKFSDNMPVIKW